MAPEPGAMGSAGPEPTSKIGRYEVLEELGRGGMGLVVKARNPDLNKLVAIKVLNSSLLIDRTSLERFRIEAKAGSQFSHPHLVSIFDFGVTDDGSPYMVMEYIQGESLQDRLTAETKIGIDVMLKIFEQSAKALQYIHKQGIVHRDIKASNIMLQNIDGDIYAKLVDFGIAKVLSDGEPDPQKLTKTGSVFGSPPYMSPEQCQGKVVDARSDIYSLGCVMYECLSGVPPIMGDNALQTIFGHVSTIPEPLQEMSSTDATACATARMIHRCLEKDPAARFQSCVELITELISIKGQRDAKQYQSHEIVGAESTAQPASTPQQGRSSAGVISQMPANRWKTNPGVDGPAQPRVVSPAPQPKAVVKNLADTTGGDTLTPFSQEQRDTGELKNKAELAGESCAESEKTKSGVLDHEKLTIDTGIPSASSVNADALRNLTQSHISNQAGSKLRSDTAAASPAPSRFSPPVLVVALLVIVAVAGYCLYSNVTNDASGDSHLVKAKENFLYGKSHWNLAKQEYLLALEQATKNNDAIRSARIRNYLGQISIGESDGRAALHFSAALKLLEGKHEQVKDDYITALIGLAEAQTQQSDFKSANQTLKNAAVQASKWELSPEVKGDLAFAQAMLTAKANKKLSEATDLYEDALQEYEKSSTVSIEKKAAAWMESARLFTALHMKDRAARHAQKALDIASSIKDEIDRTELIREASDFVQANAAASVLAPTVSTPPGGSSPAAILQPLGLPGATPAPGMPIPAMPQFPQLPQGLPQGLPIPQGLTFPTPGVVTTTSVEITKTQADLQQMQLEQMQRAEKFAKEAAKFQDENYNRTLRDMQKYSARP